MTFSVYTDSENLIFCKIAFLHASTLKKINEISEILPVLAGKPIIFSQFVDPTTDLYYKTNDQPHIFFENLNKSNIFQDSVPQNIMVEQAFKCGHMGDNYSDR